MDRNKVVTLRQIDYKIRNSCGICAHGSFKDSLWGTCGANSYSHEKHTGDDRQLSIHQSGVCGGFESDEAKKQDMEHFDEFVEDK